LKKKIQQERLEDSIVVMQGDVRDMNTIEDESVDLIFSNELLCELNRNGLEKALIEFHRVLRDNGQMIHAELMPIPENIPQQLFIEADTHSLETSSPKPDWFSPYSDEIAAILHKIGFKNITIKYFETGIQLNFKESVEALQNWSVDPEYIKANKENLRKHGLEYPMEHVIFCQK
jgi:ubiquinone/menaquinone biosynthesis C-methylase UbiE